MSSHCTQFREVSDDEASLEDSTDDEATEDTEDTTDDTGSEEDTAPACQQKAKPAVPLRRQPSRTSAAPRSYAIADEDSEASDAHQVARPPPRQAQRGRNLPPWKRHDIQLLLSVRNEGTDAAEVLVKLQGVHHHCCRGRP